MKLLPLIGAGLLLAGVIAGQRRVSRPAQALMLVAALALAAIGTGLVEPPNLEHAVRQLGSTLGPYTYVLVGIMAFLETGAGIGLVAPGEITVITRRRRRGAGGDRARATDRARVGMRGRRRPAVVRPRPPARPRVPARARPPGQAHRGPDRARRALLRQARRQDDPVRPVHRLGARARAVHRRRLADARAPVHPATIVAARIWAFACTMLGYVFWNSFDRRCRAGQARGRS